MTKIIKKCEICKSEFSSWKSKGQKFCSKKCKDDYQSIVLSGRESKNKGKTYEEMYGHERASEIKQKFNRMGKNNPMYGRWYYDVWVEKYGKEEADKRQQIINEKMCGENNPNFGKKRSDEFKKMLSERMLKKENNPVYKEGVIDKIIQTKSKRNHYGYKQGYYNDEYYHSSYELELMELLDNIDDIVWSKKHTHKIPYIDTEGKWRYYIPDFVVHGFNKPIIWETKGRITKNDIHKAIAAKVYCDLYGYEYLLTRKNLKNVNLTNLGEMI